jgi:AraC-like DNA-binding protein
MIADPISLTEEQLKAQAVAAGVAMNATVRAGSLVHLDRVARELGLDVLALLGRCGLDQAVLADPDCRIPASSVASLLEEGAALSGRDDFGLRLAQAWSLADIGPVSLAVAHQETLREAIHALLRHRLRVSDAVSVEIRGAGDRAFIPISIALAVGVPCRQLTEYVTGQLTKLCQSVLGAEWRPVAAVFRHAAPADLSAHQRAFGEDQLFDAGFDGLIVRSVDLDFRVDRGLDPGLRRHVEALVQFLPIHQAESFQDRVCGLIGTLLPQGKANLDVVGRAFGLNPRTLQRRLRAEGVGFADLLDRVRRAQAESYLSDASLPLSRISELLGYADGSAFTRWFTERHGMSPSRWRDAKSPAAPSAAAGHGAGTRDSAA